MQVLGSARKPPFPTNVIFTGVLTKLFYMDGAPTCNPESTKLIICIEQNSSAPLLVSTQISFHPPPEFLHNYSIFRLNYLQSRALDVFSSSLSLRVCRRERYPALSQSSFLASSAFPLAPLLKQIHFLWGIFSNHSLFLLRC
jgi:hypothetical protein